MIDLEDLIEDARIEAQLEKGGDDFAGFHKGCGGKVHSKILRGGREGLFGPKLEPDEEYLKCDRCKCEVVDDDEITSDPDAEPGEVSE